VKTIANKQELLAGIPEACGEGMAESAPEEADVFLHQFLPISRHLRVLDPQVRVIIGDKGAGKSHLFQALKFAEGRELLSALAAKQGYLTAPLERSAWLVGFETHGTAFPPSDLVDAFATDRGADDLRQLWLALLSRVLIDSSKMDASKLPETLRQTLSSPAWDLPALVGTVRDQANQAQLFAALDALDKKLISNDEYVFVTYDELDRVSPGNWDTMRSVLQGLVQFWSVYSRRWQRIRCKIFLRRDLYEHAALRGPDIAKIAWNPADIFWNTGELYTLLFKRLANASDAWRDYLLKGKLPIEAHPVLGQLPTHQDEKDYAAVVKHMFGEYMGHITRGLTLRWIPNHLKDGHGRVFPRPLLILIQEASVLENRDQRAEAPHLIHYTALRGALDQVSLFRIKELSQEEFPWLLGLERAFQRNHFHVPVSRKEVLKALRIDWSKEKVVPAETEPNALLGYLAELGIVSFRSDGRIDVGDLYLKGLHLRRKGGVARPKSVQR